MATITQSIGSAGGRDFATLQAWADALPANLVTDGNSYVGQCYNDTEFTGSTNLLTLAGHTTDSTHTITLTTGPGQSFRDNANVDTTALRYNPANGVAITSSVSGGGIVILIDDNFVTVSNLQVFCSGDNGFAYMLRGDHIHVDDCIGACSGLNAALITQWLDANNNATVTVNNCCFYSTGAANASNRIIMDNTSTPTGCVGNFNFCTICATSDSGPPVRAVFMNGTQTFNLKSCALFGAAAVVSGSGTANFTTCMTDVASPPSGVTGSETFANQFTDITQATPDWREKAGADLQGAGTADPTNGASDIRGLARPQGGKWDIGCWELAVLNTGKRWIGWP